MSILRGLLGLGAGYGRQAISRILPASEERILGNLRAGAPEMLRRAAQKDTGFTFDPRRNAFLEPGKQQGSMMGSMRNLPGETSAAGTVSTVDELLAAASKPEVMSRLRRGQYVGGWNPAGEGVGLDPSRRFLTRYGAIRSGQKTDQIGGFDLLSQRGYGVNPRERVRALMTLGLGTGVGGAVTLPAAASFTNLDEDFLAGLRGDTEGKQGLAVSLGAGARGIAQSPLLLGSVAIPAAAGAFRAARNPFVREFAGEIGQQLKKDLDPRTPKKAYMRPDILSALEEAGVPRTAATAQEASASLLRRSGFTEKEIDDLGLENLTPDEARGVAYRTMAGRAEKYYAEAGTRRGEILAGLKARVTTLDPNDIAAANTIAQKAASKPLSKGKTALTEVPLSAPTLTAYGVRPVRHVATSLSAAGGKPDPTLSLARLTPAQAAESMEDIIYNLERFIDPESLEAARNIGAGGWFYPTMYAQRMYMSALMKEPGLLNAIKAGIASHKSSPLKETQKIGQAAQVRAGTMVGGKMINDINAAVDQVVADMVSVLRDPRTLKGAQDKVLNYFGTQFGPFQNRSSVVDSWMIRAAFGNPKQLVKVKNKKTGEFETKKKALDTTGSPLGYGMIDDAVAHLAQKYGIDVPVAQEIIWRNVRMAAERGTSSRTFANLDDDSFAAALRAAEDPTNVQISDLFQTSLLRAVQQEPDLAKYFTIEGDDLMFTDEFFKVLKGIQKDITVKAPAKPKKP